MANDEQMDPPAVACDREALRQLFEDTRRRLIDTGTRGRLINVNGKSARGNILNITNGRPDAIYATLSARKAMCFHPLVTVQDGGGETSTLIEASEQGRDVRSDSDTELQTQLEPGALQKKLLNIAREAQTAEEEQGVNILFLALGFLRWFEDEISSVPRDAPLLLLPVELVRNRRTSTFDVRLRDDDLVTNLPLHQRFKEDFGIHLPEIEVEEEWQPSSYFGEVEAVTTNQRRWSVDRNGIQLGFFSFSKLLMYRDLAPAVWPDGALHLHPLVRGLLFEGFEPQPPLLNAEDRLDEVLPPSNLLHVVDADSSQARVIEEARGGRNLVVQGPPGTGKSQTITNIIAAAVREGKTVLFVAEKMAALSVVYDRLVKVGLQDICLELHSKRANKKAVLAEFARTLSGAQALPSWSDDATALTEARDQLNAITHALHKPIGASGETAFSVLARQVRYVGIGAAPPSIKIDNLAIFTAADEKRVCDAIESYGTLLSQTGPPARHPLRGIRRTDLQPVDVNRLPLMLADAQETAAALLQLVGAAIAATGLAAAPKLAIIAPLLDLLDRLVGLPNGADSLAARLIYAPEKARLAKALDEALAWSKEREAAAEIFLEHAFSTPLFDLRAPIAAGDASFFRRLGRRYRKASRILRGLLRGKVPASSSERLAVINRLWAIQEMRRQWGQDEADLGVALGEFWQGERTDFEEARVVADWCRRVSGASLAIAPDRAISLGMASGEMAGLARALRQVGRGCRRTLEEVAQLLELDPATLSAPSIEEADLREVTGRLETIAIAVDNKYHEWAQLSDLRAQLEKLGADPLATQMEAGLLDGPRAVIEARFARAEQLWREAITASSELRGIRSLDRHQLVARFAHLDRQRLKENVSAIRAQHLAQLPQGAMGEMRVVRGEIGKKRAHIALRRLFATAPNAIKRIKPVLLMSPISVAQFLPPGALTFDLLVIDEASQVRPEDALGAIARARQIVVVGDQKQLAPTSFFDRLLADESEEAEDVEQAVGADLLGGAAKLGDLESILTLCEARGLSSRMLQWHYRSRVPSLIRVSNQRFYEGKLILPPSPFQEDPAYGLRFTRVDGVYDRGGNRDNRKEGEAIVQRVIEHARDDNSLSLGIVTFSSTQRNLITELLEATRRQDASLDEFLHNGRPEDVFIKNIENVQGDERDVILVSVGYGSSTPGGRLGNMSFGPINGDGGERRLNVLFTRARVRCEIFASFDPGDIDPGRVSREGPRALRQFLEFAKSGRLDEPVLSGELPDSPFEEDVAEVVRSFGFLADPQVGSAGFRIDLGIRHSDHPGKYVLAIECDGATYHSALWARERDRLRQDVLEHLGWRFHRIWSTDWFYNRRAEIDRLREALVIARERSEAGTSTTGANNRQPVKPVAINAVQVAAGSGVAERRMPRYVRAIFPIRSAVEPHEADRSILAQLAIRIIEAEGPIHIEEVSRRIAASFGRERAGSRILSATKAALDHAQRLSPDLVAEEPFWFTRRQSDAPPVRDRTDEEGPTLKASNISLLEIRVALQIARDDNPGGDNSELMRTAARLLGFRRVGAELHARLAQGLENP